jgi:chaperonin cofactor prefoldin
MKLFTAYRTAIASMENEIKTLNMDANLHELMGADYPKAINASKQRKRLQTAIETLQAEIATLRSQ